MNYVERLNHPVIPQGLTQEIIRLKVDTALRLLILNDIDLLERDVHERSITHKLAEYLRVLFSEWHVDSEYNRNMTMAKTLYLSNGEMGNSYPDIIIHRRNSNNHNLLVIEAKPYHHFRGKKAQRDMGKIVALCENEQDYKFTMGLFVTFDCISSRRRSPMGKPYIVHEWLHDHWVTWNNLWDGKRPITFDAQKP